ncbi:MAG: winged helix-turn-helix transcriptional regulator [Acidobacteria bacterium]|nr:winged helix-turn-helix transcriptional regulator [Acidobacteriota bacterium]
MEQLRKLETTFKALADRTRLRILGLLLNGEICVCHIHESLKVPQPTASRHLAYLRRAGLVETRKEGLRVYYRPATPADALVRTLLGSATHCLCHVPDTRSDRARLQKHVPLADTPPQPAQVLACCMAKAASRSDAASAGSPTRVPQRVGVRRPKAVARSAYSAGVGPRATKEAASRKKRVNA